MIMENLKLSIARDFTVNPGVRYPEEDNFSGQEFREEHLRKLVNEALEKGVKVEIDLDGTSGLGPSFLEEAFGGLIREGYEYEDLKDLFIFKSVEIPYYVEDIMKYMKDEYECGKRG